MGRKKMEIVTQKEVEQETVNYEALKQELEEYVIVTVRREMQEEIEKANKKIIHEKNKKIVFRNIVILLLFAIIGFLLYLLNSVGYFNRFFTQEKANNQDLPIEEKNTPDDEKPKEETKEVVKPTLEELKIKYAHYLDSYYISEKSAYLKEYYSGNLTNELKNYLALNLVNLNLLKQEDDYQVIDANTLKDAYGRIFSSEYQNVTFDYNENKIRFISSLDAYLTERKLDKTTTNIVREIISIEEKEEEVAIKTVEGIVSNSKLYSIDGDLVSEYNNDSIINYQDKLNQLTYSFSNGKLVRLSN